MCVMLSFEDKVNNFFSIVKKLIINSRSVNLQVFRSCWINKWNNVVKFVVHDQGQYVLFLGRLIKNTMQSNVVIGFEFDKTRILRSVKLDNHTLNTSLGFKVIKETTKVVLI